MLKLDDVIAKVTEKAAVLPDLAETDLRLVVIATIEAVGFHLGRDGEVCDPRPAPREPGWSPPRQQNVRWGARGGSRRRG